MNKFLRISSWMFLSFCCAMLLFGCSSGGSSSSSSTASSTGTASLSLTDAPIVDASDVEGVFITVSSISYNINDDWIEAEEFTGPQVFNLLELTDGVTAFLDSTELPAGTVSQIRFMLDAPEDGQQTSGNPGCFIEIDPDGVADDNPEDNEEYPLFVPSGGQSGYKAVGAFDVPANGTVEVVADFDVRKSVVYSGNLQTQNGRYILKPTIRLIVNNQSGDIEGSFTQNSEDGFDSYVVFAYESEAYTTDEAANDFPNAVTSGEVFVEDENGVVDAYILPFLAAGEYDLIVAGVNEDGSYTYIETEEGVTVVSEEITIYDISLGE